MSKLCLMCEGEDATILEFCEDCYTEMQAESYLADKPFLMYWHEDDNE